MLCNNLGLWEWHKWKWKIMPHRWLIIVNALNRNANQIKYSYSNDFFKAGQKWVILSASSLRKMVEEFLRMNGIVENLMQRLDGDPISVWDFFRFSAMRMAHIAEKFYSVLNTVYSSCSILKISNNIPINKKYKLWLGSVTTWKDSVGVSGSNLVTCKWYFSFSWHMLLFVKRLALFGRTFAVTCKVIVNATNISFAYYAWSLLCVTKYKHDNTCEIFMEMSLGMF